VFAAVSTPGCAIDAHDYQQKNNPGLMLPEGITGKIVLAWRSSSFELVLSEPMLTEISRVLAYPKIRKHIAWSVGVLR